MEVSQNLKIELPGDPVIPLLSSLNAINRFLELQPLINVITKQHEMTCYVYSKKMKKNCEKICVHHIHAAL